MNLDGICEVDCTIQGYVINAIMQFYFVDIMGKGIGRRRGWKNVSAIG